MDTISPERVDDDPSARMTNRMSGRSGRVEVLPRADRRRSWTLEQKREIVSESLGPELTPTEVARKHGLSTGQIYTWRHQLLNVRGAPLLQAPRFASVQLTSSGGNVIRSRSVARTGAGGIDRDRAARRRAGSRGRPC